MIGNKANVDAFDRDAASRGGYVYTDRVRLSSRFANARISQAILAAAEPKGRRVVDLGCGDGAYTTEFVQAGAREVLGIDPAPTAVAKAQRAAAGFVGCSFEVRSVYKMPRPGDERFDVAVLRGVLHHLRDPEAAVAAALRTARNVVILEPNGLNPVLKVLERVSPYHRAHEEQSFLPGTIDRWCERGGGRVTSRAHVNLVPMFCPDWLATLSRCFEPVVERVPGLRSLACGQYLVTATALE